jgi:hypothetical protein
MQINLGQAEQIVRGVVGAGLILLTGAGAFVGVWKIIAVAAGAVAVFTASSGHCPLYRILGLGQPERPRRTA